MHYTFEIRDAGKDSVLLYVKCGKELNKQHHCGNLHFDKEEADIFGDIILAASHFSSRVESIQIVRTKV